MNEVIGKKIKKQRIKKGLTQKELADALLISQKSISKWEIGVCAPDIDELCNIAQKLDIKIDKLLGIKKKNIFLKILEKIKPRHIEFDIELKIHFKKD